MLNPDVGASSSILDKILEDRLSVYIHVHICICEMEEI